MDRNTARRWIVKGSVQGVGFRFFVQDRATALGLRGWTRNLDDGTVEVYAEGPANHLSDLAAALHKGPSMAHVRSVEEHEAPIERCASFSIR
jgi:acylphosphatase